MNMKSLSTAATILLTAVALTQSWAADTNAKPERPKPLKVLMIGNSQCPLIVSNHLIENLAKSNKDGPIVEITGCVKGGATLKSHWDAGTGPKSARGPSAPERVAASRCVQNRSGQIMVR